MLLVLYVGTQLVSGLVMSVTADKSQRTMMFVLPLIFVPFVISFPAGLILYWITTNFWTIGQQYAIQRIIPAPSRHASGARRSRRRNRLLRRRKRRRSGASAGGARGSGWHLSYVSTGSGERVIGEPEFDGRGVPLRRVPPLAERAPVRLSWSLSPWGASWRFRGLRGRLAGVGPALRMTWRWRCSAAGSVADVEDLLGAHGQGLGGALQLLLSSSGSRLPFQATRTPFGFRSGDGELGQGREAAYGSGGDDVVGLAALAAGEVLGAGVEDGGVGDARGLDGRGA